MMSRNLLFALFAAAMLSATGQALAQSAPAPVATVPTGCPAPGEGRGPRPGGMGAAGQRGPGAPGAQAETGYDRPAAGPPKKRLLIWADTRNGIAQHDIGHAMAVIEELGYKSGLYDTWIRTDSNIIAKRPKMTTGEPASGGPSLCNVDAIFFLGHREIELDAQGKADLLWFVHDAGKGFVAAHVAVTAFDSWPEFGVMFGGRFDQHPWGITEAPIIVLDPNFPGMKDFGAGGNFKDEFYQISHLAPDAHVIMRLDTSHLDMTRSSVKAGDSYALAYAKMYGKGRVFYFSLGHAPATWDDPRVQAMYLGAIQWAMGMVDADITPNSVPASTSK